MLARPRIDAFTFIHQPETWAGVRNPMAALPSRPSPSNAYSSALPATRERGTLEISFSAAPRNVAPAVALVQANLRRLRTQPIGVRELERARIKLIAGNTKRS